MILVPPIASSLHANWMLAEARKEGINKKNELNTTDIFF
jgi:hypothetical protein